MSKQITVKFPAPLPAEIPCPICEDETGKRGRGCKPCNFEGKIGITVDAKIPIQRAHIIKYVAQNMSAVSSELTKLFGLVPEVETKEIIDNKLLNTIDYGRMIGQKRFQPIGLSDNMKLELLTVSKGKGYTDVLRAINHIDGKLLSMPIYTSPKNYKKDKKEKKEILAELREEYKTGGKVLNVMKVDQLIQKNKLILLEIVLMIC